MIVEGRIWFLLLITAGLSYSSNGTLDILTFNVAGLPQCFNKNGMCGSKATNTRTIGNRLTAGQYSIVHVQEDFNYHKALYSSARFPYRTSTSGGVPVGSGLNTLSQYPWSEFRRVKWKECFPNDGDCLTPKGFTYMRVQIAPGVEIDLYNLHADAGSQAGDIRARESNFAQVRRWMDARSTGRAVILAGDVNQRYTSTRGSLNALLNGSNLRDAWVELVRGDTIPDRGTDVQRCSNPAHTSSCESVDKLLYRGSATVHLTAERFEYTSNAFLQPNGRPLSDHNPIAVRMRWESE